MKYGKTILGTLLTIGALMVPVSTKAQMPLGMKIQTVNSLLFEDEKTHKIEEVKLPPMRQLTKKRKARRQLFQNEKLNAWQPRCGAECLFSGTSVRMGSISLCGDGALKSRRLLIWYKY